MLPADPKRTGLRATPVIFQLEDGFLPDYAEQGKFELHNIGPVERMIMACPGCGQVKPMTVGNPKPATTPSWQVVGPLEAPTMSPSIDCKCCCGWHGFLENGVFRSC